MSDDDAEPKPRKRPSNKRQPVRATLPAKQFLYTLDQMAGLLGLQTKTLAENYIFYEGVTRGGQLESYMRAKDISPDDKKERDWRVSEEEFVRWMEYKGYRIYRREVRVYSPWRDPRR